MLPVRGGQQTPSPQPVRGPNPRPLPVVIPRDNSRTRAHPIPPRGRHNVASNDHLPHFSVITRAIHRQVGCTWKKPTLTLAPRSRLAAASGSAAPLSTPRYVYDGRSAALRAECTHTFPPHAIQGTPRLQAAYCQSNPDGNGRCGSGSTTRPGWYRSGASVCARSSPGVGPLREDLAPQI